MTEKRRERTLEGGVPPRPSPNEKAVMRIVGRKAEVLAFDLSLW